MTFDTCSASGDGGGISLSLSDGSTATFTGVEFSDCTARKGAGISALLGLDGTLTLTSTDRQTPNIFTECVSSEQKGAIYVNTTGTSSTLAVRFTTFTHAEEETTEKGRSVYIECMM